MAIPKVFGTETEYGIAAAGAPDFNPVLVLVPADLDVRGIAASHPLGLRAGVADARRSRLRAGARARGFGRGPRTGERDPAQRRALLRRPRPPRVLHARMPHAARAGDPRQGGGADPGAIAGRGRSRPCRARRRCRSTRTTPTARATPTARTRTTWWTARRRSATSCATSRRSSSPRIVFTGAGKVGAEAPWDERGRSIYQLTQRADFFETEVGLETTLKRPIINTRDEPHADPEYYRRLHVIVGDANMCEVSTFLKIGTTAIVLKMIEDHVPAGPLDREPGPGAARGLPRHHLHARGHA